MGLTTWGAVLVLFGIILLIPPFTLIGILFLVIGVPLFIIGLFSKGARGAYTAATTTHCPYCKTKINKGATVCPHCQRDLSEDVSESESELEESPVEPEEESSLDKVNDRVKELSSQADTLREQLDFLRQNIKGSGVSDDIVKRKEDALESELIDLELRKERWIKCQQKLIKAAVRNTCPKCKHKLTKLELTDRFWCKSCDHTWSRDELRSIT